MAKRRGSRLGTAGDSIQEAKEAQERAERAEQAKADADAPATGGVKGSETAGGLRRVSTYISRSHFDRLRRAAERRSMSQSGLIKLALTEWLDDHDE